jgi:hypothetical protein
MNPITEELRKLVERFTKDTGHKPNCVYIGGMQLFFMMHENCWGGYRCSVLDGKMLELWGLQIIRTMDDWHLSVGYKYE